MVSLAASQQNKMIKNQIYKRIRKYSDEYLLGFDQDNLDIAVLSGNIQIKNVKFNAERINEELVDNNVPFILKHGLIGNVNVKLNLLSIFTNPVNVNVSDIVLVLAPNNNPLHPYEKARRAELKKHKEAEMKAATAASSESKLQRSVSAPFDESDFLNLYEKGGKEETSKEEETKPKKKGAKLNSILKRYILLLVHNLELSVSRVHIRIEEDLISPQPFTMGFSVDKISFQGGKEIWKFNTPNGMKFKSIKPEKSPQVIKNVKIYSIRIYCDSVAKILPKDTTRKDAAKVPSAPSAPPSMLERLKPILQEVVPLKTLKALIHDSHKYLIEPFSIFMNIVYDEPNSKPTVCADILLTKLQMNVMPSQIVDMLNLLEFMNNFYLWPFLRQMKPKFRPRYRGANRRQNIRQWFMLAIWYVRIKKLLKREKPLRSVGVQEFLETQLKHDPKFRRFPNIENLNEDAPSVKSRSASIASAPGVSRNRSHSANVKSSTPMTLSELEDPVTADVEPLEEEELDININLGLRMEKIALCVFDTRLLTANSKVHPAMSLNLDVICVSANVKGKDDVKAKIMLHDFYINAAVETPVNELTMLMRDSIRVNQSRYLTPMRGRRANESQNLIFDSVKSRVRSPDVGTRGTYFVPRGTNNARFDSVSPLKNTMYVDDHTDTTFTEQTFIQMRAAGDPDSAISVIVTAAMGNKLVDHNKSSFAGPRGTHTPSIVGNSIAVSQIPRVSEARSQANSLYDALHGPSRTGMRGRMASPAVPGTPVSIKSVNADVHGETRKVEIFYSNAMLENLCRIAKVYKGLVEFYKPDPIVGQAASIDKRVTKVMKEWAEDEKIKQQKQLGAQAKWMGQGPGAKLMRRVAEVQQKDQEEVKKPKELREQIDELHQKLKPINFKVNFEIGGVMICLMSENRRHAVAQIIIPRGPITVAKNAYNMRLGVYGFGFTTNNQIPSLFQYAMNAKAYLEGLSKSMEGKTAEEIDYNDQPPQIVVGGGGSFDSQLQWNH